MQQDASEAATRAAAPPTARADAADRPAAAIEAPSGKGAGDENFPVGSALIAPELRPVVARYYAFARAADDVADAPDLAADDKIRRLDAFDAGLRDPAVGPACAVALGRELRRVGVPERHASDLLVAFRQDAVKARYKTWDELVGYCEHSANPVGRFLLDLHGESRASWAGSDALCTVLQVLNHLQDLKGDLQSLDRVYAPLDWLEAEGIGVEALAQSEASPALRRVIDRILDRCDALLAEAAPLAGMLKSRRMAAETAVIVQLANRLAARLRAGDPIAGRVKLSKLDFAAAALFGGGGALLSGAPARARRAARDAARRAAAGARLEDLLPRPQDLDAKAYAEAVVTRSGTSFAAGMKILSRPRREAMFAVYAFCRLVDDIADGPFERADKHAALDAWREELGRVYAGRPASPAGRALMAPIDRFALPEAEFALMIEGMRMDADGPIRAPGWPELLRYTRRVAGSVGMLSMRIFGAWIDAPSERFALALADAFQLTNILRDVEEDAAIGRLYLPREALDRAGAETEDLAALARPQPSGPQADAMRAVCGEVGALARARFAAARREIPAHSRRALTPALMMMGAYERYLDLIEARDWRRSAEPVRLSGERKLLLGLGCVARPMARAAADPAAAWADPAAAGPAGAAVALRAAGPGERA